MSKIEISKKKLLSLVNENLQEMAMDFTSPDRPETGIQSKLASGETSHENVPYPETENPNQNFQELLASERYQEVITKLREYVPNAPTLRDTGQVQDMMMIVQLMMTAHNNIVRIENAHREQLEALAIELVMKEMGIPEGSLQFDVKIVGMGEIDMNDFNREGQGNPEPEGGEEGGGEEGGFGGEPEDEDENFQIEEDLFTEFQNMNLEKIKRTLINSLIQGAAKKGHYMYHYVADQIRQITGSNALINQYGILMSINDTLYWQVADETMKAAMGGGANGGGGGDSGLVGGKESVNVETDPPTIIVRGVNFPVIVHELVKGIMELFGTRGRSADDYEEVEQDDTMENEIWDLRLGPVIWNRLRSQFPEEILIDENKIELQNYLLTEIFELPARKFLVFFKEVLTKSDRGKRMMYNLMENVHRLFENVEVPEDETDDFQGELEQAADEVSDEDLTNFLTSLGIKIERGLEFNDDQLQQ